MADLIKLIVINKNVELPVYLNDNFQSKREKVRIEFSPVAEVSKQLADKLTNTYPDTYAIFDPKVHKDSKDGYKIANNYRKPEFENIFNKLSPDQRDTVLRYMNEVKDGKVGTPEATKSPVAPVSTPVVKPVLPK